MSVKVFANKLNHRKTTRRPKDGQSACVFRCLKRQLTWRVSINLYPQFEKLLRREVEKRSPVYVIDVWDCFKNTYNFISQNKPESLREFGVQTEVFLDGDAPTFYFAFHYAVECVEDEEEYSFYEMVYCEFELASLVETLKLHNESMEICEEERSIDEIFVKIENWWVFELLGKEKLPLLIHSTEM